MLNDETLSIIRNLSRDDRDFNDNVKAFLTFGHLFKSNVAVTLAHTYVISGKPALNADAMAGVVRRYIDQNGVKICAYIRIVELTNDVCTIATKRADEIEWDFEHTWTFSVEDAGDRGLLKQRAWKSMRKNMLHKRCLTALLRVAYPEIIGQSYSPDELAEVMIKDEDKRDEIIFAQVEGERPPREERQPSRPPQPQPQPRPPAPEPQPVPKPEVDTLSLEEDAIAALEAYDPHWRKDPGDYERRMRMTKAEMRVELALQMLPPAHRVELWNRYGEGAQPPSVVIGATPAMLDLDNVPF
jgi:hypothetical protein